MPKGYPINPRRIYPRLCKGCGQEFQPPTSRVLYCSYSCARSINGYSLDPEPAWYVSDQGYLRCQVTFNGSKLRVLKHRWMMERRLKRLLLPSEDVHHKDENKLHNEDDNLELLPHGQHTVKTNASRDYETEATNRRKTKWPQLLTK